MKKTKRKPASDSSTESRKSKIRNSNHEFNKRMTILDAWKDYFSAFNKRKGDAYPKQEANKILKEGGKVDCPISGCNKTFTTFAGLRYHYQRCNLPKTFLCKKCDPPTQVSTRGEILRHLILSHMPELPELNKEQKELVQVYFNCENKSNKRLSTDRRQVSSYTEEPLGGLRVVREYKSRYDLSQNVNKPYANWKILRHHWNLLESPERDKFLPPELNSVRFRTSENVTEWTSLSIGQSTVIKTENLNLKKDEKFEYTVMSDLPTSKTNNPNSSTFDSSVVFFTGGINTAASWLPKPVENQEALDQHEIIAIAVDCCSMNTPHSFKDGNSEAGLIQFWTMSPVLDVQENSPKTFNSAKYDLKPTLSFMIAHNYGRVYDMAWSPLGSGWQSKTLSSNFNDDLIQTKPILTVGYLAIACDDGQVKILAIPHLDYIDYFVAKEQGLNSFETFSQAEKSVPIFRTIPTAILEPPGVGPSTDYQPTICRSLCWNVTDFRLLAAGYGNGNVALFDLSNISPLVHSVSSNETHTFNPIKCWTAHSAAITGVAFNSTKGFVLLATGSIDRQVKIWNCDDLNFCLAMDRAPVTRLIWDYRARGFIAATDSAFTSFSNRVSYRCPILEGQQNITVSCHRACVWGLTNSIVTNAIATSDAAGEVFVTPILSQKSSHKRDKTPQSTNSLFSMIPVTLSEDEKIRDNNKQILSLRKTIGLGPTQSKIATIDASRIMDINSPTNDQYGDSSLVVDESVLSEFEDNCMDADADFSAAERPLMNKPTKFLLPIEHQPVVSYHEFKKNFGIEFVNYSNEVKADEKLPENCSRAADLKQIFCDRSCDYPFSSINCVTWSPNLATFSHLLSASQIGLCRLDRVAIVEQVYSNCIDNVFLSNRETQFPKEF